MKTKNHYRELFEAKNELHKLLKRVVVSTKLGRQRKYPDDDIELYPFGNGNISSCARYGQVRYYPEGVCGEYELDNDTETIKYLIMEITKRYKYFRKSRDANKLEYIKGKKKFAERFFNPPLKELLKKYGDENGEGGS